MQRQTLAVAILGCLAALALCEWPTLLESQSERRTSLGIAWDVRGAWHQGAAPDVVRAGFAIFPGALLEPEPSNSDHSITILLPDGQRVLYECFTTEDCARGFRVPWLQLSPDKFATELLARIRAVLAHSSRNIEPGSPSDSDLYQDEAVVALGERNQIDISGPAESLQNGRYSYVARSLSQPDAPQVTGTTEKMPHGANLRLPGPGLYEVVISDLQQEPRIDLLVAAINLSQRTDIQRPFERAHRLFFEWNEDCQGWPVHEFQRALLTSLMLGIKPKPQVDFQEAMNGTRRIGVAAEPQFSPVPGAFKEDVKVRLRADTPGAVIHFTVDGSQPFRSSPVYRAPIIVKGADLMVKAFASAPDKNDSPVVTGIFKVTE